MTTRRIAVFLTALGVLAGCSLAPNYQYVSDESSGVVVQIPKTWMFVDGEDILAVAAERAGADDAVIVSRWLRGFHADGQVAPKEFFDPSNSVPAGVVRSRYLLNSEMVHGEESNISARALLDQLDDLALIQPNAEIVSRVSYGVVSDAGANGVGYDLTLAYPTGTVRLHYIAVGDVRRGLVNTLIVGCSSSCYEAHSEVIEQIASTFTVISTPGGVRG